MSGDAGARVVGASAWQPPPVHLQAAPSLGARERTTVLLFSCSAAPHLGGRADDVHRNVVRQHAGGGDGARGQHLCGPGRVGWQAGGRARRRMEVGESALHLAEHAARLPAPGGHSSQGGWRWGPAGAGGQGAGGLHRTCSSRTVVTTSVASSMAPIHLQREGNRAGQWGGGGRERAVGRQVGRSQRGDCARHASHGQLERRPGCCGGRPTHSLAWLLLTPSLEDAVLQLSKALPLAQPAGR